MSEFKTPPIKEPGIPVSELVELRLPPHQETALQTDIGPSELGLPSGINTVNGIVKAHSGDSEHQQVFAVASAYNEQMRRTDTLVYKLGVDEHGDLQYVGGMEPMDVSAYSTHWFGRDPQSKKPGEPAHRIQDARGTVSRLHFGLRKDESGNVFVVDAGSTNGTSVMTRPGQAEQLDRPKDEVISQPGSRAVLNSAGIEAPAMITYVPTAEELKADREEAEQQERMANPLNSDIDDYRRLAASYQELAGSPPEAMPEGLTHEYELSLRSMLVLLEDGAIARHAFSDDRIRSFINPALQPRNLPAKPNELEGQPPTPVEKLEFPHELRDRAAEVQAYENLNHSRGWIDESRGFDNAASIVDVARLNAITNNAIAELLQWAVENDYPVEMARYIAGNRNSAVHRRLDGQAKGMERWR